MINFVAMQSFVAHAVELIPHPGSRSGSVRKVGARVCREAGGTLTLAYSMEGDLARLRVPPPRPSRIALGLWQHTCCECFIALEGRPGYHEFNLAPSSEWTTYAFVKYREGAPLADEALNPQISVRRTAERIELDASIGLERLSIMHPRGRLALALSAVVEDQDGGLSYWALWHPAGKPDFHHRDSFALTLENP